MSATDPTGTAPAAAPEPEAQPRPGAVPPGSESPFALATVTDVDEAKRHVQELQRFVASVMVKGVDYGTIPGTPKPSLWKAGAEKLCELYGLTATPTIEDKIEDWEKGFFYYRVRIDLINRRSGYAISHGVGSANSMEGRYRWRWVWEWDCSEAEQAEATGQRTRKTRNGAFKKQFRLPNDDVYSLPNTLLKMASKRAKIDAVLAATRSSGVFTQDVIDEEDKAIDAEADEVEGAGAAGGAGRRNAGTRTSSGASTSGQGRGARGQGQPQRAAGARPAAAGARQPAAQPPSQQPPSDGPGPGPKDQTIDVRSEAVDRDPGPEPPPTRGERKQPAGQPAGRPAAAGAPKPPAPAIDRSARSAIETLAATLGEPQARIDAMIASLRTPQAVQDMIETLAMRTLEASPDGEITVQFVCGHELLKKLTDKRTAAAGGN